MAEIFREREQAKPQERLLPSIQREQREFHSPLDSLSRVSIHLRIPAETTRRGSSGIQKTDLDMRIARNSHALRMEGSTPLHERFLRMIEAV